MHRPTNLSPLHFIVKSKDKTFSKLHHTYSLASLGLNDGENLIIRSSLFPKIKDLSANSIKRWKFYNQDIPKEKVFDTEGNLHPDAKAAFTEIFNKILAPQGYLDKDSLKKFMKAALKVNISRKDDESICQILEKYGLKEEGKLYLDEFL